MQYRYYTVDVFTETRFGGNQLAVLPEAEVSGRCSGALFCVKISMTTILSAFDPH